MDKEKEAFQDLIGPENHCHGCGCANEKGMQLKSYWDGNEAVARYQPERHHCAGMPEFVHGGILGGLMDCHGNNLAMASAYHRENRMVGSLPKIWYVTARMEFDFKNPVPVGEELELRAKIIHNEGRKCRIQVRVLVGGKICVEGTLLQIRIKR